jgi:glycosidase
MRVSRETLWQSLSVWTRPVIAALLSWVWRGHDQDRAEARLAALSPRDEAAITAAVLLMLFLAAVLAAQFGWLGMGLYFLAVILLVR